MVRPACRTSLVILFVLLVSLCMGTPLLAVMPAADVLPSSTCLYVSFPDMDAFTASFRKTQLGELANDPAMKPFADDLASQLRDRFGETDFQLGLKWEDLKGVYSGEACLARVQPDNKQGEHATILLVDVTDHDQAVQKIRQVISSNLKKRGASESRVSISKAGVTAYLLPKKVQQVEQGEVYLTVVNDQLLLTNHRGLVTDVIQRMEGGTTNRLADHIMFKQIMEEVATASQGASPHLRWFADPFKYADVIQASRGARRRRGKDFKQILRGQGFDAIRAVGGHVELSTKDYELIHRTLVYAPTVTDQPTKFNGAARILAFPATNHLPLPMWMPRNMATFLSLNWNVLNGFNYLTSLIDEVVDSEGFVEDVLESFETDTSGPMINIRTALLAHLDDHIVMFSDFEMPITPKSERLLVAVRVKDEKQVQAALKQLWEQEPQAREVRIGEHVVWEIVPEDVDLSDIELPGIPVPGAGGGSDDGNSGGEEIKLPNAAMTVVRGPDPNAAPYLMISTSIDLLSSVLDENRPLHETLGAAADFRFVNKELENLGAGKDSMRFFSRTDEEYRLPYEMVRQGKMPESESVLGRMLNAVMGPEEENVLRKPRIDGKKLPDYQIVRRYLGPAGLFVKPRDDGWFVTGIMVSKTKLIEKEAAAKANLSTTARNKYEIQK